MALIKKGSIGAPELQAGATVRERDDGLLEGTARYKADQSQVLSFPATGSQHPADARLKMVSRTITYGSAEYVYMEAEYMGIVSDPTPTIIQFPGATGSQDITRHPTFSTFAGTPASPLNGATWTEILKDDGSSYSPKQYEWLGFTDPADSKYEVASYLVPNSTVILSYWTASVPRLKEQLVIVRTLDEVQKTPDIKNWLRLTTTYRQITQAGLYQVEEVYLGSDINGHDEEIYSMED